MRLIRIIKVSEHSNYFIQREQIENKLFFLVDNQSVGNLLKLQDPLSIFKKVPFLVIVDEYQCDLLEL
jgi:hypothetical protein